jgi:(2Fe-2S) ferredoxin
MRDYMKQRAKEMGFEQRVVRINTAGCLDRCEEGPVIVIYPQGVWYTYVDKEDINEILSEHLQQGRIVERLRLDV